MTNIDKIRRRIQNNLTMIVIPLSKKEAKPQLCIFCSLCVRVGTQKFSVHWCENKQDIVKPYDLGCNLWNERDSELPKWIKSKL